MNLENVLHSFEHLTGFVIVILALCILWGLTALAGRLFSGSAANTETPPPPSAAQSGGVSSELDEDLVVVAAAAAAMIDGPHRIVSMRKASPAAGREGRN